MDHLTSIMSATDIKNKCDTVAVTGEIYLQLGEKWSMLNLHRTEVENKRLRLKLSPHLI